MNATRTPEPEFLIKWREWRIAALRAIPPKFCHSCDYYDKNGNCRLFNSRPPDDFTITQDACGKWSEIDDIPF